MPGTPYASWHQKVAAIVRSATGQNCRVIESSASGGFRAFELAANAPQAVVDAVARARGGRTSAVPLYATPTLADPTIWLSWYERWDERRLGSAEITDMSATFYWGIFGRPRIQLLRAEWVADHVAPNNSAQPHWQVDTDFVAQLGVPLRPEATARPDLVELPAAGTEHDEIAFVSISGLHLAMAGWRNAPNYPDWWRFQLGLDERARAEWLRRLLQHAADQFVLVATA